MSNFDYSGPRMQFVRTRSGLAPARVPARDRSGDLAVRWYAPKPAWMDHIPGPFLRFGNRQAFDSYLRRTEG